MISTNMISVNVPGILLNSFDRVCRHAGRSRTAALLQLMRAHVLQDGKGIIDESRRIATLARCVKKSRENRETKIQRQTADVSEDHVQRRSKTRFSAFLKPDSNPKS